MRKTLTLSALATGLLFASKASTQTPTGAYAVPLPGQAVPQAYLPPPVPPLPPRPPEPMAWTATRAEPARLVTKVFDITEIILQVGTKGTPSAVADRAERLTSLLEGFVEPNSWKCAGGRGSMVFFAENYALVVNNEPAIVAKVDTWLDKLRGASKPEVKVGIDRIRCDSATLAKLGFAGRKANEPIPLTPDQLAEMRKFVHAQAGVEVLESPRLNLLNNQTGFVQLGQHVATPCTAAPAAIPGQAPVPVPATFVGISYRATPRIMPDGRTILLRLESEQCDAAPCKPAAACTEAPCPMAAAPAFNVQSTAMTFSVPNGGTVLVPMGSQMVAERIQTKVPVIADLPMFDKLFSHTRTEPRQYETFVLVTANTHSGTATVEPLLDCPAHIVTNVQAVTPKVIPAVQQLTPALPTEMPSVTILPTPVALLQTAMVQSPRPPVASPVDFVAAYRKACAECRMVEARNFALQALAADPKCFEKK